MIQSILKQYDAQSHKLPGYKPLLTIEVVTDPVELAKARQQDERFERNWAWFTAQAEAIYRTHRGQCLCISGQELFLGATPAEAIEKAKAAHPDDDGRFTRIIPEEKMDSVFARPWLTPRARRS